jgi:serine/threonine protein kinase
MFNTSHDRRVYYILHDVDAHTYSQHLIRADANIDLRYLFAAVNKRSIPKSGLHTSRPPPDSDFTARGNGTSFESRGPSVQNRSVTLCRLPNGVKLYLVSFKNARPLASIRMVQFETTCRGVQRGVRCATSQLRGGLKYSAKTKGAIVGLTATGIGLALLRRHLQKRTIVAELTLEQTFEQTYKTYNEIEDKLARDDTNHELKKESDEIIEKLNNLQVLKRELLNSECFAPLTAMLNKPLLGTALTLRQGCETTYSSTVTRTPVHQIIVKNQPACYLFMNEIRCLTSLKTTNYVPTILDAFVCMPPASPGEINAQTTYGYVTEKNDYTLNSFLKRDSVDSKLLKFIAHQIIIILNLLDTNRILHRNFSTSTIMVNQISPDTIKVYITDFTKAWIRDDNNPSSLANYDQPFNGPSYASYYKKNPQFLTNSAWFMHQFDKWFNRSLLPTARHEVNLRQIVSLVKTFIHIIPENPSPLKIPPSRLQTLSKSYDWAPLYNDLLIPLTLAQQQLIKSLKDTENKLNEALTETQTELLNLAPVKPLPDQNTTFVVRTTPAGLNQLQRRYYTLLGEFFNAAKEHEKTLNNRCFRNLQHCLSLPVPTIPLRVSCDSTLENTPLQKHGEPIGKGDYGQIWDVRGPYAERIIIKEQKSCYAYINEINCLEKLQSTGIVPKLYDAYVCALTGKPFTETINNLTRYGYAMQKLDMTLDDFLTRQPPPSDADLNAVGQQIAYCLKTLDENDILHRDFNYGNIMLTCNKTAPLHVYVIDFGNAYNKHYAASVQMVTHLFDEKSKLLFYETNNAYATNYIWFKEASEKHVQRNAPEPSFPTKTFTTLLRAVDNAISSFSAKLAPPYQLSTAPPTASF